MYAGQITRLPMPSAVWASDWMRRPSKSCWTRVPLKNCSIMLCVTAFPELRPMTLEWVEEHEKAEGEIIIQARMLTETKKNLADSQWVVAQRGD